MSRQPSIGRAPHLDQQVVCPGEHIATSLVKEQAEDGGEVAESAPLETKAGVHLDRSQG